MNVQCVVILKNFGMSQEDWILILTEPVCNQ